MANDKGSKRLIITFLGDFRSEIQEGCKAQFQATRTMSFSMQGGPLSSLASIAQMNSSARVIRFSAGLNLYQAPLLRDRSSVRFPRLKQPASSLKILY